MVELQLMPKPEKTTRKDAAPPDTRVPQFHSLVPGKVPWSSYGVGFVVQCILMALLIAFGFRVGAQKIFHPRYETLLYPMQPPQPPPKIHPMRMPRALRHLVEMKTPPPPTPPRLHRPKPQALPKPKTVLLRDPLRLPKIVLPKPQRIVRMANFNSVVKNVVRRPAAQVHTGAFFGAPHVGPKRQLDPKKVQTGGFGDPNGVHGPRYAKHGNVMHVGSFGLPEGPGQGNGSGGRHGAAGAIARIGFGSGENGGVASGPSGSVQSAGFGQTESATPARRAAAPVQPQTRSVVILYKPHPQYTATARAQHLQGDVWLSVIFLASGQVKVLHVVQGLGGGLDQAAIAAAQGIRFQPALRGGSPVNYPARIRIRFRLAH